MYAWKKLKPKWERRILDKTCMIFVMDKALPPTATHSHVSQSMFYFPRRPASFKKQKGFQSWNKYIAGILLQLALFSYLEVSSY